MTEDQLKKGSTRVLILAVLSEMPLHGYAIARAIESRSIDEGESAGLRMNEGALYPALRALEHEGYIVGEWEVPAENSGRPRRRVYNLTDAGREELDRQFAQWNAFSRAVDRLLGSVRPQLSPNPF